MTTDGEGFQSHGTGRMWGTGFNFRSPTEPLCYRIIELGLACGSMFAKFLNNDPRHPNQMSKPIVPNRLESDVYDRQIRLWGAEAQVRW
jgi:hypothetical protein